MEGPIVLRDRLPELAVEVFPDDDVGGMRLRISHADGFVAGLLDRLFLFR
jgi:hypothetical protein